MDRAALLLATLLLGAALVSAQTPAELAVVTACGVPGAMAIKTNGVTCQKAASKAKTCPPSCAAVGKAMAGKPACAAAVKKLTPTAIGKKIDAVCKPKGRRMKV
jgi:hypothetical protein